MKIKMQIRSIIFFDNLHFDDDFFTSNFYPKLKINHFVFKKTQIVQWE